MSVHAATGQSTWDRPQPPKAFPTPPPLRRPDTPPPVSALTDRATKAVTQHQVAPGSTGNAASVAASLTAAFAGAGRPSHALWDDNAFVDLFLDGYRDHQRHALTKSFAKDAVALLEGAAIGAADDWRTHLGTGDKYVAVLSAYQAIKELGDTSQMLPTGSKSEQQLLELIQLVTMKVRSLSVGAFAFIPCGWITASDSFALLIVVQRTAADELSLTVCNTGPDGLQYHPIKVDVESSPNMLYRLSFVIPNIPSHRLHDSAFWLMLFRMQVIFFPC